MNSLKTAVILAVLLGAAYWVYMRINSGNSPLAVPPGVDQGWSGPVDIQMPSASGGPQPQTGGPAATNSWGGEAPSYQGSRATAGTAGGMPGRANLTPPNGVASASQPLTATPSLESGGPEALPPAFPPGGYADTSSPTTDPAAATALGAISPSAPSAGPDGVPSSTEPTQFDRLMEIAQQQFDAGSLSAGLETLSRFYGDPRLSADENRRLTEILDQLAGTVIYSRQHLLEKPRVVRPGETLKTIAEEYQVPPELLAKINGISNPDHLQPGQQLKVVRGPFQAVVDLGKHEMTLMLQGRYAGRFRIGVGHDLPQLEGVFEVKNKTEDPTYYGPNGVISADDPRNPLGERWIGLGAPGSDASQPARIGIHGTDSPLNVGTSIQHGTICLGPRDAEDVYDILSIGSRVVIRR